jgi:hypothetical protein
MIPFTYMGSLEADIEKVKYYTPQLKIGMIESIR